MCTTLNTVVILFSCKLSFPTANVHFMWSLGTTPLPELSNGRPESPPSEHGGRCKPKNSETELLKSIHLGQCLSLVIVKSLFEKCITWTQETQDQISYL